MNVSMSMEQEEKDEILHKATVFFEKHIIENHIKNTRKLSDIKEFNVNPFTAAYLANFAFGDTSPESLAKALIYPRVLGTSIATSFGTEIQRFNSEVLSSFASTTSGIDIEYKDAQRGRHIYCQLKAGPQTINKDDVATICGHFKGIVNLARTNGNSDINPLTDCVVGILYGTRSQLSANYKKIEEEGYTVLIGDEFWASLTGDPDFYEDLIDAMVRGDAASASGVLEETTRELTKAIEADPDVIPTSKES